MPKSLFEGNIRVDVLITPPANRSAVTITELADAIPLSCAILRTGYRLSPTGSDTLNEPALCETGNSVTFGASNYEATMTLFRYLTEAGLSDPDQDIAWETFVEKGIAVDLIERIGPPAAKDWAEGDPYRLFPVITDDPQQPTDLTGYQKFVQPFGVQGGVVLRGEVAAA